MAPVTMGLCTDHADMIGRLLAGSFTFECRIMRYILCRVLLPRSTNLAQASEEDLILLWALQTGHQIDWAHLVRYRMHKALRAMHLFCILILLLCFFSISMFLQMMNLLLRLKDLFLLVLVLLLLLDTGRIWMANGCVSKTCHLLFPMNAHPLHHHSEIPLPPY